MSDNVTDITDILEQARKKAQEENENPQAALVASFKVDTPHGSAHLVGGAAMVDGQKFDEAALREIMSHLVDTFVSQHGDDLVRWLNTPVSGD